VDKKQIFIKGATILSAAGLISKLLGAVYRIPLANWIGDEGIGIYQMAYPIYTIVLALATAGIPVAISVIVASNESKGLSGDSLKLLKISLALLIVVGLLMTYLVMQSAYFISHNILTDPRSYLAIRAVAPAIFFSAVISVYRGYYQGYQMMAPTAVSQIIEQIFRVTSVLILAVIMLPKGIEYAAAAAASGASIGGAAGLIFLIGYYFCFHKNTIHKQKLTVSNTGAKKMTADLVKMVVPISLGAVVLPLVQVLDAVIVPSRLIALQFTTDQATSLYGQLTGMAAVLIGLPTIFTISISTSLSPAVSESFTLGDSASIRSQVNLAARAGMLISFPCAAGLFILSTQICTMLYKNASAGIPLAILAFSCITLGAFQISSAGLQAIGKAKIAMYDLIIAGVLKTIFNYFLTAVPFMNIKGAALGTVLAFMVGSGLNLYHLHRLAGVKYEKIRAFKIAAASAFMAVAVHYVYVFFHLYMSLTLATILSIGAGVVVFAVSLLLLREFDFNLVKNYVKGI
jgi:stage V sporulation protein B